MMTTDVLIVGAGPAGASSAVFLGKYGISTIMISRHRSTARTPRAHITNQRTMEAFRDAGLEQDCMAHASPPSHIAHSIWLRSMVGEELARVNSWGSDPRRKGDYEAASPCQMCDLPQTELEPLLVAEAARLGSHVRFSMELISFVQDENGVTAMVRDRVAGDEVEIRAKYMIGADGARSQVVEQLGLPLIGRQGLPSVINVYCEADLGDYPIHRHGALYHCVQPASGKWGAVTGFRMVRPWDRWLVSLMRPTNEGISDIQPADLAEQLCKVIGATVSVKILDVSVWAINDIIAEHFSAGRVFCMGDAVHRHPPANGLGSNTCVQDAFNLAWKMALVLQGKAGTHLLDSFSTERQPVGQQIVSRANKSMVLNYNVWDSIVGGGSEPKSEAEFRATLDTAEGRERMRSALDGLRYENHAHGVELNRQYVSNAVVSDGSPPLVYERDEELYYQPNTRPGAPLPHVWLGKRVSAPLVSSLDVAGKRRFTLLTGYEGEGWRKAARLVSELTGVEIAVVSIGPYCDYEDSYRRWHALSGISESGCVLVRPDLYIGWRCSDMPTDPNAALSGVMQQMLGFKPVAVANG